MCGIQDWRQKELSRIDETLTGAERRVALAQLIDEESQLISCIARRRAGAIEDNKKAAIKKFLNKVRATCRMITDRVIREVKQSMASVRLSVRLSSVCFRFPF